MALYHLDPRQAGTGAAPDVDVWAYTRLYANAPTEWAYDVIRTEAIAQGEGYTPHGASFDDEQSALRAAREAAGFGDVAEQACDAFIRTDAGPANNMPISHPGRMQCAECAWPRDAHKEGGK